ncbi:MAG: hypothetical protein EZS28_031737, partial [Streblomastix strix]
RGYGQFSLNQGIKTCTGGSAEEPTPKGCICQSTKTEQECACQENDQRQPCICLPIGDIRSHCIGHTIPCKSTSKEQLTGLSTDICGCYEFGDPRSQCSESKACNDPSADLSNIPISLCPCNGDDDPRRGITCPVTRYCSEQYHPQDCICDTSDNSYFDLNKCKATKTCSGEEGNFEQITQGQCTCSEGHHPYSCICEDYYDYNCVCTENQYDNPWDCPSCSDLDRESLSWYDIYSCPCYAFGDPRSECNETKDCNLAFQQDLYDVSIYACPCFQVGDPRYQCWDSKTCDDPSANLINIPISLCPCNGDNDPRRGITCAVIRICEQNDLIETPCLCSSQFNSDNCTCTQSHHDDQQCICDQSGQSEVYDLQTCRSTKTCSNDNMLIGCTCPNISETAIAGCAETRLCSQLNEEQLSQVDISICSCYGFGDPRSECNETQDCNLANQSDLYDIPISACPCYEVGDLRIQCSKSKTCDDPSADLINIPLSLCPCNGDNDPRRGIICPVTSECTSDSVSPKCLCTSDHQSPGCICTESIHPQDCECDNFENSLFSFDICSTTKTCSGSSGDDEQITQGQCTCGFEHHPFGCLCKDSEDIDCICPSNFGFICSCRWNVSQTTTGDNIKSTIQSVIDLTCDNYEIQLIDSEHTESINIINQRNFLIKVSNRKRDDLRTNINNLEYRFQLWQNSLVNIWRSYA